MKKKIILVLSFLIVAFFLGTTVKAQLGNFFKFSDKPTVYKAYSSPEEFLKDGGEWDAIQNFDEPSIGGGLGDYLATSTAPNATGYLAASDPLLVKGNRGVFGSVIVTTTGTAGGTMNFYDATTTNSTLRKSSMGTSSIIIASLPTNLAAGTYVFDVAFANGLLVDFTGTPGTTTITFK